MAKLSILAIMGIVVALMGSDNPIYPLSVVREFPGEGQRDNAEYFLNQGTVFDISGDEVFFCDQFGNKIVVFDIYGKYLRTIGRQGQGPGEFNAPRALKADREKLFVLDNMNKRTQIFTPAGEFLKSLKTIVRQAGLEIVDDKIFILSHQEGDPISDRGTPFIKIFDQEGARVGDIWARWKSRYKKFDYDNYVTMRWDGQNLHCLQKYGVQYKVFNSEGKLIKECELSISPFDDEDYKKIGYMYAFQTFCFYNGRIYTTRTARGSTIIDVFDADGRYLFRYQKKHADQSETYHVSDMKIIERENSVFLFMLYTDPDVYFSVARLDSH